MIKIFENWAIFKLSQNYDIQKDLFDKARTNNAFKLTYLKFKIYKICGDN